MNAILEIGAGALVVLALWWVIIWVYSVGFRHGRTRGAIDLMTEMEMEANDGND